MYLFIVLGLLFLPIIILILILYLGRKITFSSLLGIGFLTIALTIALTVIRAMLFDKGDLIGKEIGSYLSLIIMERYYIYLYIFAYLIFILLFLKQRNNIKSSEI